MYVNIYINIMTVVISVKRFRNLEVILKAWLFTTNWGGVGPQSLRFGNQFSFSVSWKVDSKDGDS
jgi:hypothetical protein